MALPLAAARSSKIASPRSRICSCDPTLSRRALRERSLELEMRPGRSDSSQHGSRPWGVIGFGGRKRHSHTYRRVAALGGPCTLQKLRFGRVCARCCHTGGERESDQTSRDAKEHRTTPHVVAVRPLLQMGTGLVQGCAHFQTRRQTAHGLSSSLFLESAGSTCSDAARRRALPTA